MSQQINLYEIRLRPRHELPTSRNLGIGVLALLVLMTALSLWTGADATRQSDVAAASRKQLADEQEKLLALGKEVAQRRISPALIAELDGAKAMLATGKEVMAVLDSGKLGNTSGFSPFIYGFARQARKDLWLTGFQVTRGGTEIEIRGRLLDPATLPAYVQRLSNEPVFQGRRFAALEMRDVEPEEQQTDAPAPAKVTASGAQIQPQRRLPRYVEFTLRSENAGDSEAAAHAGAKQ